MKTASSYDWVAQRERGAFLALESGDIFHGYSIGAAVDCPGEVVFNTVMTGYQEVLSDPSYSGRFVCLTAPEIGVCGVNQEDMESDKYFASGLLVHRVSHASNWRARQELTDALVQQGTCALAGVDTRALASCIRDKGALRSFLSVTGAVSEDEAVARARGWEGLRGRDYVLRATCVESFRWDSDNRLTATFPYADEILPPADYWVVAYDFGVKRNLLRGLRRAGISVTVVPAGTDAEEVLGMKPDGVFFSNGPGDPSAVGYGVEAVRGILGRVPVLGIGMGHQLLGVALGGRTCGLSFGHHGCNHPVKDLMRDQALITSQSHNYVLEKGSLPGDAVEVTHVNLNDGSIEGIRARNYPAFSVQFHPGAGVGGREGEHIFGQFYQLIRDTARSSRRVFTKKGV